MRIKNNFVFGLLTLILVVIITGVWFSYSKVEKNLESFVVLVSWEWLYNNNPLILDKKVSLKPLDYIETKGETSLAIIEWWDGSVTRLGSNSKMQIQNSNISADRWNIAIEFELFSWKSWSNVISFLWEGSYFKQNFVDSQASVRGTVFNVDLEKEYISVTDHKIELLSPEGKSFIISKNKAFSLSFFDFISLQEFITKVKDKSWEQLNKKHDIEFLEDLKKKIAQDFNALVDVSGLEDVIDDLSNENKAEKYKQILRDYQKIKFAQAKDVELFSKKLELQKALISLSDWENKQQLLKNSYYDIQDALGEKSQSAVEYILPIIQWNKSLYNELELENIWEKLKNSSFFEALWDKNLIDVDAIWENIKTQDLQEKAKDLFNTIGWDLKEVGSDLLDN